MKNSTLVKSLKEATKMFLLIILVTTVAGSVILSIAFSAIYLGNINPALSGILFLFIIFISLWGMFYAAQKEDKRIEKYFDDMR